MAAEILFGRNNLIIKQHPKVFQNTVLGIKIIGTHFVVSTASSSPETIISGQNK